MSIGVEICCGELGDLFFGRASSFSELLCPMGSEGFPEVCRTLACMILYSCIVVIICRTLACMILYSDIGFI